jgi:hypothetical protein
VSYYLFPRDKEGKHYLDFFRIFCPKRFDGLAYQPSVGRSGGILNIWDSSVLSGDRVFQNSFPLSVDFKSAKDDGAWTLTNIYAPCQDAQQLAFLSWFHNIQVADDVDWLIVGDFNLIRSPNDRNKPGGNINEMLLFNEAISNLGLIEIPLKGKKFTWSNMQAAPLLQRLDWFFTSLSWTTSYPNTIAMPLAMTTFDHIPCVISFQTTIPKSQIFRFENRWLQLDGFLPLVEKAWTHSVHYADAAKRITSKFKVLRKVLKHWAKSLSSLKVEIEDCNFVIALLDSVENCRSLIPSEVNLRISLKDHLAKLLKQQLAYWKQRGKIKWVTLGDSNSKFFHSIATVQKRKNHIATLSLSDGKP